MLRNSLIREMAFKANFLLWMGVELLWFIGQIVFLEVIFGYVDQIGDWTKWEVVLLVGTHQLIAQSLPGFLLLQPGQSARTHPHRAPRFPLDSADRYAIRRIHKAIRPR